MIKSSVCVEIANLDNSTIKLMDEIDNSKYNN